MQSCICINTKGRKTVELFQIKHKGPRGSERIYVIANGFADIERFIERRKLEGAKYKRLATDYASPRVVDVRGSGAREAGPQAVPLPARYGARLERLKENFSQRMSAHA